MVKHPVAQIFLHPDGGAEETHPPQKAAQNHAQNDTHHGHTDAVQQEIHVKGHLCAVHRHIAQPKVHVKWKRMLDCTDNQDVGLEAATH